MMEIEMGEIAEMMIDGTLCEGCGVYLDGESYGVARRCPCCRKSQNNLPPLTKVACKTCGRNVKAAGLNDHMRDAHGAKQ